MLALAITSFLAVGCGGGSGSASNPDNNPPSDTNDPPSDNNEPPVDDGTPPVNDDPDGQQPGEELPDEHDSENRTWVPVNDSAYRGELTWVIDDNGEFRQTAHVSNRYQAPRSYAHSFHRGSFLYLREDEPRADFDFSTVATLGDEQGLGVMFRYQRSEDGTQESYYRVSMSPRWGFTRFEKRIDNRWESIAVRNIGHQPGDDIEIRAVGQGPVVMVYIDGEPMFSHYDTDLMDGTVALYSQGHATFRDVQLADVQDAPAVVISVPVNDTVSSHFTRDGTMTVRAHVINAPNAEVDIALNGVGPATTRTDHDGNTFTAQFDPVDTGDYELVATLSVDGTVVSTHTVSNIGVGRHYISIGDGVTAGSGDEYMADNVTADGRMMATGGMQANLATSLSAAEGVPVTVFNEAIPSLSSAEASHANFVNYVLSRYTDPLRATDPLRNGDVDGVLLLLGATDVGNHLSPADFEANVQTFVNRAGEYRDVHIATAMPVIPAEGDLSPAAIDSFGLNAEYIQPYNDAIRSIAAGDTRAFVGPDLYQLFRDYPDLYDRSRPSPNAGYKHPNSLGHAMMGECWSQYLQGQQNCSPNILLGGLTHGLEQNLVEVGGRYYVDTDARVTALPSLLEGGIWVKTRDSAKDSAAAEAVSFTVPAAATVYVGYAAGTDAADRPAWLNDGFTPTGETVATSGGADLDLFAASYGAGQTVTLGGNRAGDVAGGANNYVVIVAPQ
ncbi:SGNH/GDSL hydrolase family protein [Ectothiorhodospiraceae bacterium 2226]|nr:SGNH/GDSL hydrolase family protein [Ectothiorhodospiraceae bacterium 2226]